MVHEHDLPFKPIPFPGYPVPFWFRYIKSIEKIINEFKLQPIPPKYLPKVYLEKSAKAAAMTVPIIFDPGIRGGNRGPHLHLGDNIYILEDKQWKVFSEDVVSQLQSKLKKANTIAVQDVMALDNTISGLSIQG